MWGGCGQDGGGDAPHRSYSQYVDNSSVCWEIPLPETFVGLSVTQRFS